MVLAFRLSNVVLGLEAEFTTVTHSMSFYVVVHVRVPCLSEVSISESINSQLGDRDDTCLRKGQKC